MTAVDWLQPLSQGSVISCQTVETFPGRQVPLLFGRRLQLSFLQHEIPEAIPVSLKALFQKSESSGEGHSVSLDSLQSCQDSYSPNSPAACPLWAVRTVGPRVQHSGRSLASVTCGWITGYCSIWGIYPHKDVAIVGTPCVLEVGSLSTRVGGGGWGLQEAQSHCPTPSLFLCKSLHGCWALLSRVLGSSVVSQLPALVWLRLSIVSQAGWKAGCVVRE